MEREQHIDLLSHLPANVARIRLRKLDDYTPLAGCGGVSANTSQQTCARVYVIVLFQKLSTF